MKQLHAIFHGTVQGVGFRYTTERLARQYDVTGYVKNMPDGSVELKAEGDEKKLQDFLYSIRESSPMSPYIRDTEIKWCEAEGKWKGFGVQY